MSLIIEKAQLEDAEAIAEIAQAVALGKRAYAEASANGYLGYPYNADYYRNAITTFDHCLVARKEGKVVGFLTSLKREKLLKEITAHPDAKEKFKKATCAQCNDGDFYLDRMAVLPAEQSKKIGSLMYEKFLELIGNTSHLVCTIMEAPVRNTRSINFFKNKGWEKCDTITEENGEEIGLFKLSRDLTRQ